LPLTEYTEYGWPSLGDVVCPWCGWEYRKRVERPIKCPACQKWLVERKLQGGKEQKCKNCGHQWTTRRPYASRRCPECDHALKGG